MYLGGALSHDGHTQGIVTPSLPAQIDLIQKACSRACVKPEHIQYLEAHGTGTAKGDKVEGTAIGEALCKERKTENPLYIGTYATTMTL